MPTLSSMTTKLASWKLSVFSVYSVLPRILHTVRTSLCFDTGQLHQYDHDYFIHMTAAWSAKQRKIIWVHSRYEYVKSCEYKVNKMNNTYVCIFHRIYYGHFVLNQKHFNILLLNGDLELKIQYDQFIWWTQWGVCVPQRDADWCKNIDLKVWWSKIKPQYCVLWFEIDIWKTSCFYNGILLHIFRPTYILDDMRSQH